jgi:hypothetical protein
VRQNPPASGQLTTIGALGIDVASGGFDIGTNNTAYGAFTLQGQTQATLYSVNLSSGQASPVTGNAQSSQIGTSALVISQGVDYTVACNEACTVTGTLQRGGTTLGTATSFVQQPGRVAVQINLTAAGRNALQNVTSGVLSLRTVASDFFGNDSTVTRIITLTQ